MKPRVIVLIVLIFVLGVVAGRGLGLGTEEPVGGPAPASPEGEILPASFERLPSHLTDEETRTIEVFRRASASVVYITSVAIRRDFFFNALEIPRGSGSGFVWDKRGHIVTNFHVLEGGSRFVVTLADQSEWEAGVVGAAKHKDLAVLRIDAPANQLLPLEVGRSRDLVVGQRVMAIGNPFGLDHSLTAGVVSALGRELQSPDRTRVIRDVIQTDAAINPGNSGGPLLDSSGRLVGINTAIYSPSGASAGIGFAVPVDAVRRLVPQLIDHGRPIQPGIRIGTLPDSVADRYEISGVVVTSVARGGPADRAGLEGLRRDRLVLGDLIVGVNGEPVDTQDELLDRFETLGVGTRATLTVEREGKRRDVEVELVPPD